MTALAYQVLSPTVLVVDDSPTILAATRAALTQAGYHVVTRDRPLGVCSTVLAEHPDVIVLDVDMPALSGDRLLPILRQAQPGVRVVLYSARTDLVSLGHAVGADEVVPKCRGVAALVDVVHALAEVRS